MDCDCCPQFLLYSLWGVLIGYTKRPVFPLLLVSKISHASHTQLIVRPYKIKASFMHIPGYEKAYGIGQNIENTPGGRQFLTCQSCLLQNALRGKSLASLWTYAWIATITIHIFTKCFVFWRQAICCYMSQWHRLLDGAQHYCLRVQVAREISIPFCKDFKCEMQPRFPHLKRGCKCTHTSPTSLWILYLKK